MASRRIDLLSYLPEFLREYKELNAVQLSVQPELQSLIAISDSTLNNMFISTADDAGLRKYETMLNITVKPSDTLEERRQRVIMYWNDVLPYTYRALINRLRAICGSDDNFTVTPDFSNYKLDIVVELNDDTQIEELDRMLYMMIPANIVYTSRNMHRRNIDAYIYKATATVNSTRFIIDTAEQT